MSAMKFLKSSQRGHISIPRPPIALRISASKPCSLPGNVSSTYALLVASMSVAPRCIASAFSMETAARPCVPTFEVTGGNDDIGSAFTAAIPMSIPALGEGEIFNRQSAKQFSFDICAHTDMLDGISKFVFGWLNYRVAL